MSKPDEALPSPSSSATVFRGPAKRVVPTDEGPGDQVTAKLFVFTLVRDATFNGLIMC